MRLRHQDLIADFENVYNQMRADRLDISLVGHAGEKTLFLGNYFSQKFNCNSIELPSIIRKGRNVHLAKALNNVYPYFPESILRILSHQYMKIHERSGKIAPPTLNLNGLIEKGQSILIVDDNTITGDTLELWKDQFKEKGINTHTFAITATGDYKPDYYCMEEWRSFAWRPIGM